jgi:hypothetical protein
MKEIVLFMLGILLGGTSFTLLYTKSYTPKPISYPKEIQIAKAGDTLVVVSVSDSIYLGFKNK